MSKKELLTSAEKAVVKALGECASSYKHEILEPGPSFDRDLSEFMGHIHDLQWRILAQAAARTYPDDYRLQGASFR